jgi:glycosyltransferase involved in cell wall biosynthesis
MRIGICIDSFDPSSGGGYTIEHEILNSLVSHLKTKNYIPVIFSNSEIKIPNTEAIQFKANSVVKFKYKLVKKLSILSSGKEYLKSNNFRKAIIEKSNIDVFIYLNPFTDFYLNIPYISIVWDLQHILQPYFPEFNTSDVFEIRQQIFNKKLKRSSYIITGTERGKNEVSQLFNVWPERIRIIPIPTPSFALNNQKTVSGHIKNKYSLRDKFIFYPAQFWPHKNHINLINALKILIDKGIELDLVLVGSDKGNKAFVEGYIKEKNLANYVKFPGFVSTEDMVGFYKECMALTFVTFFGPDNLPPLEAFALNCPVIASNVPGAEEQLGDAAIIVEKTSPKEIANAIELLYTTPSKAIEMKEKGLIRALERRSENFAVNLTKIIEEFESISTNWK